MIKRNLKTLTKFSTYWLAFFLFGLSFWIKRKFGEPSFEQVIFHLQFGPEGLVDADKTLIKSFFKNCVFLTYFFALLTYGLEYSVIQIQKIGYRKFATKVFFKLKKIGFNFFYIIEKSVFLIFKIRLPVILLLVSSMFFLTAVSFWSYIESFKYNNFIDKNYIKPEGIIAPKEKRNLILIYVESLENTYRNKELFGRNLLKTLDESTTEGQSFEDFFQTMGTGWTIAGIVSSQCGVPLRPWFASSNFKGLDGNTLGEKSKSFLPNILCLGDILKENGYKNVFLGGADHSFAGKGKFLSAHGYEEIWGKVEWEKAGEKEFNDWGLNDDRLFDNAKNMIKKMYFSKIPFNLTILTVGTHHPNGFVSKACKKESQADFPSIVECTSKIISNFLNFIKKNGFDEKTDIAIMGDHLSMVNNVYDLLSKENKRTIYNKFLAKRGLTKNTNSISHFNIFPTILNMLGFEFKENRLGLGVSGFGEPNSNYKINSEDNLSAKLGGRSELYWRFWGYSKNSFLKYEL